MLLRLLLIGYLYGITSERRLLEEVKMHLAYRWFTRLDFGAEIPEHSTFSKNRHGRFRQSGIFREVQFLLAATAHNLKRPVRFLKPRPTTLNVQLG